MSLAFFQDSISYSICDIGHNEITIGVKKVKSGIMSNYLVDNLKLGDELEISGPDGRFIVEPKHEQRKSYLFLAAGIGITPIYKMIKVLLEQEPKSEIYLLYSNTLSPRLHHCYPFQNS